MTESDVTAFYGDDPLAGAEAVGELAANGVAGLEAVLPTSGPLPVGSSRQVEVRLRQLAQEVGPDAIPLLLDRIERGEWFAKVVATPAFAAFRGDPAALAGLTRLAENSDIDGQRKALEALGHVADSGWAGFARDISYFGTAKGARNVVDAYSFGKFGHFGVIGVLNMFAGDGDPIALGIVEDMVEKADEVLSSGQSLDFEVEQMMRSMTFPAAADALIGRWLNRPSERLRRFALIGLGALRLHRTIDIVAAKLGSEPDPIAEAAAGIALGETIEARAAKVLAEMLARRPPSPGMLWAFSTLYALDADWPADSPVATCLREQDDVTGQMLLTLGYRREQRYRADMEDGLQAATPWARATSASALARLLGSEAQPQLSPLAEEGSSELERTLALAALIHAGREDLGDRLHAELRQFRQLHMLRRCWKREILSAVAVACGPRTAQLWAEMAGEPLARVERDLPLLLRLPTERAAQAVRDLGAPPTASPPAAAAPPKPRIFLSYSHRDSRWLDDFVIMLKPGLKGDHILLWSDQKIGVGALWREEIEEAMRLASVAVFLVSADFIASRFVEEVELPTLLAAAEQRGLKIFWIAVRPCLYGESRLSEYQCANDPSKPLSQLSKAKREQAIADISREILAVTKAAGAAAG